jgi:hypothetical protein
MVVVRLTDAPVFRVWQNNPVIYRVNDSTGTCQSFDPGGPIDLATWEILESRPITRPINLSVP